MTIEDLVVEYSKVLQTFPKYKEFKEEIDDNHYLLFTELETPNKFHQRIIESFEIVEELVDMLIYYENSSVKQTHTKRILILIYRLLAKIMWKSIKRDNVKAVLKKRKIIKEIMIRHLKYDVASIDGIIEFVKDNRKSLYNFK